MTLETAFALQAQRIRATAPTENRIRRQRFQDAKGDPKEAAENIEFRYRRLGHYDPIKSAYHHLRILYG